MRMRVLRWPIVFFRVRCSILILLIKTDRCSIIRCSILHCTFRETGWKGVTGLMWLKIGTTFGFHKTREDPRLAEGLLAAEVEHHCAPFCNVRRSPWASVPSCAVLSERERWFCSGVLYTVVCVPEGRVRRSVVMQRGTVLCRRQSSANYVACMCWLSLSSPASGSPHVNITSSPPRSRIPTIYQINVIVCTVIQLAINPLKFSGHYMYHQVYHSQFYVLSTQFICVFCVNLRTNSDYFPIKHLLVFITEM
jgi:hypothetical protein